MFLVLFSFLYMCETHTSTYFVRIEFSNNSEYNHYSHSKLLSIQFFNIKNFHETFR